MTITEAMDALVNGNDQLIPVVVEAPATILDEEIYEGLPGREDEEGNILTFRDWGGTGNQPMQTSTDGTRVLMSCTIFFAYIPASQWMLFDGKPGIVLHDSGSYQLLKEQVAWQ